MSETIVLKKGLTLPITGSAKKRLSKTVLGDRIAVMPDDFKGLLPRLLVKEGDRVLAGSAVLSDKKNPDVLVTSPVSGVVEKVVRGDKRKLLAVVITPDTDQQWASFDVKDPSDMSDSEVKNTLLASGLWLFLKQRPYGIIANPELTPKGIFVSAFNSTPGAADLDFALADEVKFVQKGIDALSRIAPVHVSFNAETVASSPLSRLDGVQKHYFKGRCPAGNVGVQISHISPIKKDETVWTITLAGLAAIGKLFSNGKVDMRRLVAISGPMAIEPAYVSALPGTAMSEFKPFYGGDAEGLRIVSGDVLTGRNAGEDGFLSFTDDTVTLIKEGTEKELLGWVKPLRLNQYSTDHCYFSWLFPSKRYDMDTNIHGGPRAFVMSDSYYSKVLPMDIYPLYLIKACLAGNIEGMEKYGIYEVLPEDLAACEFVDPSKNNIQDIIAKGIDLMLKEMA